MEFLISTLDAAERVKASAKEKSNEERQAGMEAFCLGG
jgi:hypothetical protein